ncbi:MAG: hypothetical protein AMJ46_00335 [Latescibacteria bacterium DG_63]|nr:MAG: hypothetical protein AMJ46_00335 [Latescibacteria bacterium DG_63]
MASNIEIKAWANDFQRQQELAVAISDTPPEHTSQEDIFFNVPRGRLKLRVFGDKSGELIYYSREDTISPRVSHYSIFRTHEVETLRTILSSSLGVRGLVRKRRTVYRAGDIRIHLDRVEDLGDFIELEYVMRDDTVEPEAVRAVRALMPRLHIEESDLIGAAYIDLVTGGSSETSRSTQGVG